MSARLLAAGWCVIIAACSSAPVQEMSDARMAIAAADAVNAESTSPRTMLLSRQLLEQADAALRDGAHERARQNAGAARVNAIEARRSAVLLANAQNAIQRAGGDEQAETLLAAAREAAASGDDSRAQQLALQAREKLVP